MSQNHQEIADAIVDGFMQQIDGAVLGNIPQSALAELSFRIREALDAQTAEAASQVEQLSHDLRMRIERPQIEL